MCLLTNERCKTYQTRFSFGRLSHALGVGPGGTVGVQKVFPVIQPDLVFTVCSVKTWKKVNYHPTSLKWKWTGQIDIKWGIPLG